MHCWKQFMDRDTKQKSPADFIWRYVLPGLSCANSTDDDPFELELFDFYGELLDMKAFTYQGHFDAMSCRFVFRSWVHRWLWIHVISEILAMAYISRVPNWQASEEVQCFTVPLVKTVVWSNYWSIKTGQGNSPDRLYCLRRFFGWARRCAVFKGVWLIQKLSKQTTLPDTQNLFLRFLFRWLLAEFG